MPQRLKPDLRAKIVVAAAEVFATRGYPAARLAEIAQRAGTSTSNLYKYFKNKSALFERVFPAQLVDEFVAHVHGRVDELNVRSDWDRADAQGSQRASALLAFWIEHRELTIFLLSNAEGTDFAGVRDGLVREMVSQATRFRAQHGQVDAHLKFVLEQLFARTLETIAEILLTYRNPPDIRRAISLFWRYQLAGLHALLRAN